MKLDPEGVEKAAEAYRTAHMLNNAVLTGRRVAMEAALTAYFDHLREIGKMRECRVWDHSGSDYWSANTGSAPMKLNDFMGVIIRAEKE